MDDIMIVRQPAAEPIMKSITTYAMMPIESTLDDKTIAWPYDQNALFMLYESSAEHMRACQIKSECAYGNGVSGSAAPTIKTLMPPGVGVSTFYVDLGLDLEVYGNSFAEVIRAGNRIIGLRHLPARTMYRTTNGGYVQWVYPVDGQLIKIWFEHDEVVHFRSPCPANLHYSLPPWIGGHGMIELVYAAIEYNASFFRNRAIPDYAIISKNGKLSSAAKEAAKLFFQNEYMGVYNAHRALYMDVSAGTELEFKKLTEDRKDADFLKLLDAARDRIITAHGVPPRMMGIMSAGQLGGGGEVIGQLHVFEEISCKPRRRRMAEQSEPFLDGKELFFGKMDVTPPMPNEPDVSTEQKSKSDKMHELFEIWDNI